MSFLLRTQVGPYQLDQSHTLQEIEQNPEACRQEPVTAVSHLPHVQLTPKQADRITNGVRTTVPNVEEGRLVLLGPEQQFLGIGKCLEGRIQAEKIFAHYRAEEE